jgi:hypothetical protein
MGELEEAYEAVERRQTTIQDGLKARVDSGEPLAGVALADVYRLLYSGMDLDADSVIAYAERIAAESHDEAQAMMARVEERMGAVSDEAAHRVMGLIFQSLVLEGFTTAAMLFHRRERGG